MPNTRLAMPFYAHTSKLPDGKTTNPDTTTWEPLFTQSPHPTSTTKTCKPVCYLLTKSPVPTQ